MKQSENHEAGGWISRGLVVILLLTAAVSCGPSDDGSSGEARWGSLAGENELLARRFTYLVRGDDDFPTLTSKYRLRTQPAEDQVSHLRLIADPDTPTDGEDSCQVLQITLKDSATVMAVVADSIGSGMVCLEFGKLPPGEYTFGARRHPVELTRWTKDCKRLVISVVVGDLIRHRARWRVTEHDRLVHRLSF